MLGKALGINFPNIIDHFMLKNSIIIVVEEYQKNKEEVARNQGTNTIVWNLKKKKKQGNQETEPWAAKVQELPDYQHGPPGCYHLGLPRQDQDDPPRCHQRDFFLRAVKEFQIHTSSLV